MEMAQWTKYSSHKPNSLSLKSQNPTQVKHSISHHNSSASMVRWEVETGDSLEVMGQLTWHRVAGDPVSNKVKCEPQPPRLISGLYAYTMAHMSHIHKYTNTHIYVYIHEHAHIFIHKYAHTFTYVHLYTHNTCSHMFVYTHVCTQYMYTHLQWNWRAHCSSNISSNILKSQWAIFRWLMKVSFVLWFGLTRAFFLPHKAML